MSKDYYKLLEVSRSASNEEIHKAYRKLARKYHPDLAEDKEQSKQKFQEVQNAYDVLSDPKKRQLYDQLGPNFEQMGGRNPFEEYARNAGGTPFGKMDIDMSQIFGGGKSSPGGFEDFLKQFGFGGAGGPMPGQHGPMPGGFPGDGRRAPQSHPAGPQKGGDVNETVTIPFATAIMGGKYSMSLQRGDGRVEDILIKIPQGIDTGKKIRLRGQGTPSLNGGPTGDLLVKILVASHPSYSRRGQDLHVDVPISLTEAIDGTKIELPTPHGKVTLTIPAASSGGAILRLKGLGIPESNNRPKGDLFARLHIQLPEEISDEDRQTIQQLEQSWPDNDPRKSLQW